MDRPDLRRGKAGVHDEDTFARPGPIDVVPSEKYVPIIGGPRHPSGLVGQERLDHRKWWLGLFNKKAIEAYRSGLIADIVDAQIDRIAPVGQGRAGRGLHRTGLHPRDRRGARVFRGTMTSGCRSCASGST